MNWLKRLFRPKTFDIGGVEPDLDEYSREEREDCINQIMASGKSREKATELADSWFIMEVQASYGHEPMTARYVPRPVWDWDWMWRPMFDTREEAVAHIESKKAKVLESWD